VTNELLYGTQIRYVHIKSFCHRFKDFQPLGKYVYQLPWRGRFIKLDLGMELLFTKFKRVIITLGLSLLFLISGEVCMAYNFLFTGLLFIIISGSILGYLLLFWILNKNKHHPFSHTWTTYELRVIPLLAGGLCISGIVESHPNHPDFRAAFALLLGYVIFFIIVLITNYYRQKKGIPALSKPLINKLIFWTFAFGVGRIIILIEEYGDSDALIIVAFFYFPLLIILILRWIFKQTRVILTLKNEKAKTELLHLKSQVNPHFFFNMLNNLYGLVGTDAKKAQNLILKLSDMMRYSIYEGEKDTVSLEEEVEYLKNYIELHKMRYRKEIDIKFTNDISENLKVMPLLFIILLENAFKHGVENLRENAYIHINMKAENNQILFNIENNFDPTIETEHKGIGLNNLKRRLELVYPKNHTLSFLKNNDVYKAQLNIKEL
jgi:two-component system sensor histidine kinase AlgZ